MELMERRRILLDTPHISLQDGMQFVTDMVAPIESLVINFSPIQDLHGYDNPWPAGGGKNLCDPSTIIVGFWDGTGTYSADANYKTSALIPVEPNTNYTGTFFKADKTEVNKLVYTEWDSSENFIKQSTSFDRFVTTANTAYVRVRNYNAQSSLITSNDFLYQFEKGSATSYAPYSNICPISGWTGAQVVRAGINIFDKTAAVQDAFISDTNGIEIVRPGSVCSGYISVVPNTTYYIKSDQTKGAWGAWYDENKTYISGITGYITSAQDSAKTKTAPSNARYMRLTIAYAGSGNPDTLSVNYPSTDHDYHPYTGRSITIDLGQTVYGGTLDVTTGVLTVDRAMVDMGEMAWNYNAPSQAFASVSINSQIKKTTSDDDSPNFINSIYKPIKRSQLIFGTTDKVICENTTGTVIVSDLSFNDATAFKTAVAGQTIVYELATPQTYQLTPQQILALKGINNLSMSGQVKFWTHRDIQ